MKLSLSIIVIIIFIFIKGFSQTTTSYFNTSIALKDSILSNDTISNHYFDSLIHNAIELNDGNIKFQVAFEIGLKIQTKGQLETALNLYNIILKEYKVDIIDSISVINKAKLFNGLGAIYGDLGGYDRALWYYHNSLNIIDSIGWVQGKALVYNNMGKLYALTENYEKSVIYFKESMKINQLSQNVRGLVDNYNNIAGVYRSLNKNDNAIDNYLHALELTNKESNLYVLAGIYFNLGGVYFQLKDYDLAISYFKRSESIQADNNFYYLLAFTNISLAEIYKDLKNIEKASFYLDRAKHIADNLNILEVHSEIYLLQSELYAFLNNHGEAYIYILKHNALKDSLIAFSENKRLENIETLYRIEQHEKNTKILEQDLELSKLKIEKQKLVLFAVLISGILAIISLIILFFKQMAEKKAHVIIHQQQEQIFAQKELMMKEKEVELKSLIDFKNRQLTSYTLNLIKNNELFGKIISKLRTVLTENIKEGKKKQIQQLIVELRQSSTDNSWDEFKLYFEEVHQSFHQNLLKIAPDLTPNDQKIAAFLRLGLTTKEISAITFREIRSIESTRLRLRKKLGLLPDTNLTTYLTQF